ncbi:MAG: ferrous iron transporter B [Candidatus Margulisiibacteriota bacterium]
MRYAVLFGPPNAGKTTLFNQLTGRRSAVVNYPGSTVDISTALLKGHESLTLIDVPGVQSFIPRSDDEKLSMKAIAQLDELIPEAHCIPDLVICVIDATQRSRHLAMTKRLIDDGYPVIVIISMMDEAKKNGIDIDHIKLSQALGVSVFKASRDGAEFNHILDGIKVNSTPCGRITKPQPSGLDDMLNSYEWAKRIMSECEEVQDLPPKKHFDLDRILLHPIWGYISFLGIMLGFFSLLFFAATPFIDAIDLTFVWGGELIRGILPAGLVADFIVDGLIAGLGGVLVFVPQILFLFIGIGLMEGSGYLARSAVLIDKPLSKVGLNGRSFVPLLSGCACAIPAILATRNIPNKKVRFLTMIAVPLMQCSARLPVYGLLLAALFESPIHGALGLTAIYVGSIIFSGIIVAIINLFSAQKSQPGEFIIQLPQWRIPKWKELLTNSLIKTSRFITGAGPIIVSITVILWMLGSVELNNQPIINQIGQWIEPLFLPMGVDWRVGVALIFSFAAREVFVSALIVVFQLSDGDLFSLTQLSNLKIESTGELLFTNGSIIGLILFFMIAMQCGATFAVLKKEMNNYKVPSIIVISYFGIAYFLAVLENQLI